MRRIVHISDLHFGRVDTALVEPLLDDLDRHPPDVVAVSGDLTQRATRDQFAAARRFLDRLPAARVVVPGNHDISLWNVLRRFARPLDRFRRHVGSDVEPDHVDPELHVAGINTARSLTWKGGRISFAQIEGLRDRSAAAPGRLRVLVTHHPLIVPEGARGRPVGRARHALRVLEECGFEVVLAGHLHESSSRAATVSATSDRQLLVVQAGTTLSRRTRREPNSYNRIEADGERVTVTVHVWDAGPRRFRPLDPFVWQRPGARGASSGAGR